MPESADPPSGSKLINDAVQTPPPESSAFFDIPTIFENAGTSASAVSTPPPKVPSQASANPSRQNFSSAIAGFLLQTGTLLGSSYEILQLLGEGWMGAVYKAIDRELDQVNALKVIRPELASKPEILQRLSKN